MEEATLDIAITGAQLEQSNDIRQEFSSRDTRLERETPAWTEEGFA